MSVCLSIFFAVCLIVMLSVRLHSYGKFVLFFGGERGGAVLKNPIFCAAARCTGVVCGT